MVSAGVRRGQRLASARRLGLVRAGRLSPARRHRGQLLGRARRRHVESAAPERAAGRRAARVPPRARRAPSIGFRPPPRDIRPPAQANLYSRLPAKTRDVTRARSSFERPHLSTARPEQRLRGPQRRGLPPYEGRTVAAARRGPLEDERRRRREVRRKRAGTARETTRRHDAPLPGFREARAAAGAGPRLLGAPARRRPHARALVPAAPQSQVRSAPQVQAKPAPSRSTSPGARGRRRQGQEALRVTSPGPGT